MLNNGLWQNRRIVSSEWIKKSTERSQQFENYGLLWWLYDEPKGFAAHGYLDTNLYVFPKQNLIVARMQSKPQKQYISHEKEALRLFGQLERK
jgi:CubicO group peptidase (beta-lactamase class C family)